MTSPPPGEPDPLVQLAGLDRERESAPVPSVVASEYARLAEFIDPSTPEGTERVRFVLAHIPRTVAAPLDLFDRTGRTCPDVDLADRAATAWASISIARGDVARAEERLWEVLRRQRGSETATERGACVNLARSLAKQSRMQEALIVSGRAYAISEVLGDPIGLAAAGLASASALIPMGEAAAGLSRMEEAHECIAGIDHPAADALRLTGRSARLDALEHTGRHDETLALLDRYERESESTDAKDAAWYSAYRACVLVAAGRIDDADTHLHLALEHVDHGTDQELELRIAGAQIAHARGDREGFLAAAEGLVDVARELSSQSVWARYRLAELVQPLRVAAAPELARQCAELAAEERLLQIIATDRCARELPEFCVVRREDREVLVQARKRFVEQQRACLAELAQLLWAGEDEVEVLSALDDGAVRVCAECTRIAAMGRQWVPLGQLLPPGGSLHVIHGLCRDCSVRRHAATMAR